jgi:hypothetical protein
MLAVLAIEADAVILVSQVPPQGGGTGRWSKMWVDPFGDNDYDSDAICYEDFVLAQQTTIEHIEWWGDAPPGLGFTIEFWRQDPGTIAYQPLAVFRNAGALAEAEFTTLGYSSNPDLGKWHYSLDLAQGVTLDANNAANPRWFIAIYALDNSAPLLWSWSQGLGGSNRTFQWIRADGNQFHVLGEGRGLVLGGTPIPEPASMLALAFGVLTLALMRRRQAPTQ